MTKLTRLFTLALFVSLTIFATGCGTGNSIQMTYLSSNLGGDYDCTKSVTVREFTDNRTTDWLGEKDDGHFSPSGLDVNEWVSQALFDELTEMGCTTNYHDGDFRTTTHYTISGSVNKAWVKEINIAEYEADFEISIVIYDNLKKKNVLERTFSSSVEQKDIPSKNKPREVLTAALRVVLQKTIDAYKLVSDGEI